MLTEAIIDVGESLTPIFSSSGYVGVGREYITPLLMGDETMALTWVSSDENIAVVDDNGVVSGVGYGTAQITGSLNDLAGRHRTITIFVRKPLVGVHMENHLYETALDGNQLRIYATIDAQDPSGYDRNVGALGWSVGSNSVLTQTGYTKRNWNSSGQYYEYYGAVFAKKAVGAAVVTASGLDGSEASDSCIVIVHSKDPSVLPEETVEIGAEAFEEVGFEEVWLDKNVESIGKRAFRNCSNLRLITIPANVVSIGEEAFFGCEKLTILCDSNSTAHAYAQQNSIAYVLVDKAPFR
jgi:hypothetical protein